MTVTKHQLRLQYDIAHISNPHNYPDQFFDDPYYTHNHPSNSEDNHLGNPDDNFDHPDIYPDNLCSHLINSKDSPDHPYTP